MHNMFANFAIILRACKHFAQELVNKQWSCALMCRQSRIHRPIQHHAFTASLMCKLVKASVHLGIIEYEAK